MLISKPSFHSILHQVRSLEKFKQEISRQLINTSEPGLSLSFIYSFIYFDLQKHELLWQAAWTARQNQDIDSWHILSQLYQHIDTDADLTERIAGEIRLNRQFLKVISKTLIQPSQSSFNERRLAQEVRKYVTAQARVYCTNKKIAGSPAIPK